MNSGNSPAELGISEERRALIEVLEMDGGLDREPETDWRATFTNSELLREVERITEKENGGWWYWEWIAKNLTT